LALSDKQARHAHAVAPTKFAPQTPALAPEALGLHPPVPRRQKATIEVSAHCTHLVAAEADRSHLKSVLPPQLDL
jgi:hypothetical protein